MPCVSGLVGSAPATRHSRIESPLPVKMKMLEKYEGRRSKRRKLCDQRTADRGRVRAADQADVERVFGALESRGEVQLFLLLLQTHRRDPLARAESHSDLTAKVKLRSAGIAVLDLRARDQRVGRAVDARADPDGLSVPVEAEQREVIGRGAEVGLCRVAPPQLLAQLEPAGLPLDLALAGQRDTRAG